MDHKLDVEEGSYGLVESPNIARVRFGPYELNTWYGSAVYFAKDHKSMGFRYSNQEPASKKRPSVNTNTTWLDKLFICDRCFKYTELKEEFDQHILACQLVDKQTGKIVYQDEPHTIRRVRGSKHKLFTQNLCLFTKLFLDNKSVFFTVDYFEFYIIYDNETSKPMGFFSKELLSPDRNNLACILIFPPYQRRRLGTLLIAFSYELSKAQRLVSGPEKPLSPFGLVGYLRYWSNVVTRELVFGNFKKYTIVTLEELSNWTGIRPEDITMTLKYMNVIKTKDNILYIEKDKLHKWVKDNNVNMRPLCKRECLLID